MTKLAVGSIVLLLLAASLASAQPELSAGQTALRASSLTPGGSVVWFGIIRYREGWFPVLDATAAVATDTDSDGVVSLDVGREVSPGSVWVVVDLTTGLYSANRPEDGEIKINAAESELVAEGPKSNLIVWRTHETVEVMLVRPGVGAWYADVGDASALDEDSSSDGVVRVSTNLLSPVGGAPQPPSYVERNDLVLVIDDHTLACRAARVGE